MDGDPIACNDASYDADTAAAAVAATVAVTSDRDRPEETGNHGSVPPSGDCPQSSPRSSPPQPHSHSHPPSGAQKAASAPPHNPGGGEFSDELGPEAGDGEDEDYDEADANGNERGYSAFSSDFSDDVEEEVDSEASGGRERKRAKKGGSAGTQRRREEKVQEQRQRVDTLMTRKLRSTHGNDEAPPSSAGAGSSKPRVVSKAHSVGGGAGGDGGDSDEEGNPSDDGGSGGGGTAAAAAAGGDGSGADSDAEMTLDGVLPTLGDLGQPVVLERLVGEETARADLEVVKGMWEWAAICEFLFSFRESLQLKTVFSMESLADALVRSPGPGLVADLHMELLAGIIHNRKSLCEEAWAAFLANRLAYERVGLVHKMASPFKPLKRQEALEYAALPVTQRVLALKELCDVRLDREDLRGLVDDCLKPPPKIVKKPTPPPPPPQGSRRSGRSGAPPPSAQQQQKSFQSAVQKTPDDYRKESLGADSSGNTFWLLDLWDVGPGADDGGVNYGTVLFKEKPPPLNAPNNTVKAEDEPSLKKKKGRNLSLAEQRLARLAAYRVPEPECAGAWQPVASSVSELEEVGLKLRRSLKAPDPVIATTILDQVIPSLNERSELEEKQRKARERTAKTLGSSWGTAELSGRSMRQRKVVSYNMDDFDNQIRQAIRAAETDEPKSDRRAERAAGVEKRMRPEAASVTPPLPAFRSTRQKEAKPRQSYVDGDDSEGMEAEDVYAAQEHPRHKRGAVRSTVGEDQGGEDDGNDAYLEQGGLGSGGFHPMHDARQEEGPVAGGHSLHLLVKSSAVRSFTTGGGLNSSPPGVSAAGAAQLDSQGGGGGAPPLQSWHGPPEAHLSTFGIAAGQSHFQSLPGEAAALDNNHNHIQTSGGGQAVAVGGGRGDNMHLQPHAPGGGAPVIFNTATAAPILSSSATGGGAAGGSHAASPGGVHSAVGSRGGGLPLLQSSHATGGDAGAGFTHLAQEFAARAAVSLPFSGGEYEGSALGPALAPQPPPH